MTRYHYVTLPVKDLAPLLEHQALHPQDAFVAEDAVCKAARDLLAKGYRWVRTDSSYAIFEKEIISQMEEVKRAHRRRQLIKNPLSHLP